MATVAEQLIAKDRRDGTNTYADAYKRQQELAPEATTVADLMGKSAAELKQTVQEVDRADFAVKKEQEKSPESRGKSFNEDIAERIEARLVKGELTFNMMPDGSLVIAAPDVAELHQTYRRDYL